MKAFDYSTPESNTAKCEGKPVSSEEAGLFHTSPPDKDLESEEPVPLAIRNLACLKRAIKPGAELMATYHANHPEIVGLVRVVTEVQTNAFYSVIKDQPNHEYTTCNHRKGFRSNFEKAANYQFDGTTVRVLNTRKGDGSVLCEFEVYEPEMKMEASEEAESSLTMTMGVCK